MSTINLLKHEDVEYLQGHTNFVYCCDISHDNLYVISSGEDCTVKLWDIEKKTNIHTFYGHLDSIYTCSKYKIF